MCACTRVVFPDWSLYCMPSCYSSPKLSSEDIPPEICPGIVGGFPGGGVGEREAQQREERRGAARGAGRVARQLHQPHERPDRVHDTVRADSCSSQTIRRTLRFIYISIILLASGPASRGTLTNSQNRSTLTIICKSQSYV